MRYEESDVRMSPLLVVIAAIVLLLAITVLATERPGLHDRMWPTFDEMDKSTDLAQRHPPEKVGLPTSEISPISPRLGTDQGRRFGRWASSVIRESVV